VRVSSAREAFGDDTGSSILFCQLPRTTNHWSSLFAGVKNHD
jgi:hypothetical protein